VWSKVDQRSSRAALGGTIHDNIAVAVHRASACTSLREEWSRSDMDKLLRSATRQN